MAPRDPPASDDDAMRRASDEDAMRRGYARARERDEAARAALTPLAPGERPWPVTVAAVVAAVLALANLVMLAAGWEVEGRDPPVAGALAFTVIMAAAAVGMWRVRYWAVLGFQVLLTVTLIYAMLALLLASNAEAVVRSLVMLALAGTLFWLLIRAMARIQAPRPPAGERRAD